MTRLLRWPRVAVDPARVPTAVLAEIATAVLDADGELGFNVRRLGQPLDASDVFGVVHSVPGVVGVVSFALGGVASTSRLEGVRRHATSSCSSPTTRCSRASTHDAASDRPLDSAGARRGAAGRGRAAPLDALLAAVDDQRLLLQDDIDRTYDDFFVETCADWALPYIAAVVGLPPDAERLEIAYAVAPAARDAARAGGLRARGQRLDGTRRRGLEGDDVGAATGSPGTAATGNARSAAHTSVAGRHAVRAPRRSFSPSGPLLAADGDGRRLAMGAADVPERTCGLARRYALHPFGLQAPLCIRPEQRLLSSDVSVRPASRGDELDTPVRATYGAIEALARTGEIDYGPPWTIADTHALASPAGDATPPLVTLFSGADADSVDRLRFGEVPAPTPPGATEVVVDVARGHVELGSGYTGVGVSAIWHRPVSGALGALAGEARKDVGAQVVVTVEPRKPEAATRVKTLEKAFELAESLSASRSPLPDGDRRRDQARDVRPPRRAARGVVLTAAEALADRRADVRDAARRRRAEHLDGASLTLEGFLLDGDLRLGKRLASVRLNAITMNAVAKRSLIVHEDAWLLALDARRCILGPIRADLGAAAISLTDCIVDGLGRALAVWHAELTHARACRGAEEPLRTGPARRGHHVRRPRRRRGRRRRRLPLRPRPLGAAHPGGLPAPLLRGPAGGSRHTRSATAASTTRRRRS